MGEKPHKQPFYPLNEIQEKIRDGHFEIKPNALEDAWDLFKWGPSKIKQCLLKLNDKDYAADNNKNHFYKQEAHRRIPHTMMDYYKARNVMDGENVYIHFYVQSGDGKVIISSFHELD